MLTLQHLRRLLVSGALSCCIVSGAGLAGCAALMTVVPLVSEIVSDGALIIGMIESAVAAWSKSHPSAPSVQADAIDAALQKTRLALVAGGQALAGLELVTQADETKAFADFVAAYTTLMGLVAPLGILPASAAGSSVVEGDAGSGDDAGARRVSSATQVFIPTPLAARLYAPSRRQ